MSMYIYKLQCVGLKYRPVMSVYISTLQCFGWCMYLKCHELFGNRSFCEWFNSIITNITLMQD